MSKESIAHLEGI